MNAPVKISSYLMPNGDPGKLGFAPKALDHLDTLIRSHIEAGRYSGAQIALARHGQLALTRSYGKISEDESSLGVNDRTLFGMFSQTKVFTSATVWTLVEEGKLSFMDRIADHLPEFAARGKANLTLHQVMTHTGGFPGGNVSEAAWTDHKLMRKEVCDFSLEWTPGTRLQYHPRGAHLVQGMLIEAVTGKDYRDAIRERIMTPLGIADDVSRLAIGCALEAQCLRLQMMAGAGNFHAFRNQTREIDGHAFAAALSVSRDPRFQDLFDGAQQTIGIVEHAAIKLPPLGLIDITVQLLD